jgi:acyl homoserine lactone synthase
MKRTITHDDGSELVDQMFKARAALFRDRLKWDVTVDHRGHERDQYDTEEARYMILSDELGQHVASCRFIPIMSSCMTVEAFPGLFSRDMIADPEHAVEITRMCTTVMDTNVAAMLFVEGARWLDETDYTSIIAVFYPNMLRVYKRAGWSPTVLNRVDSLIVGQWKKGEYVSQA